MEKTLQQQWLRLRDRYHDAPNDEARVRVGYLLAAALNDAIRELTAAEERADRNADLALRYMRESELWNEERDDRRRAESDLCAMLIEAQDKVRELSARLDAVRGRAEQDGIQAILDVLDKKPIRSPVPGYVAGGHPCEPMFKAGAS